MLTTLIVFAAVGALLATLFGVGAYVLQGVVNDAPPDVLALMWRAPAAAGVVTLMTAWLCHLSLTAPDFYAPPLDFAASAEEKPAAKVTAVRGTRKTEYQLRKDARGGAYYDKEGNALGGRPDALIIEEEKDGQKKEVTFTAQKGGDGKFAPDPGQPLRYTAPDGRYVEEGYWGRVSTFHSGLWVLYLLLNLLHLAAWFAALWPLMRFPWAQALVLSLALWAANTLLFLPLLTRASWW